MTAHGLLLIGILLSSFVTGIIIFFLREESHAFRTRLNLAGAGVKLVLVAILIWEVYRHPGPLGTIRWTMLPGMDFALGADGTSILFVTLSAILWFLTTIYAVGYLEDSPHRSRFFGFFSFCVSATIGIALSANLVTFFIFYELLTVSTYPLLVHRGTAKAMQGGKVYVTYTLIGGAVLLLAVVWLQSLAGPVEFAEKGILSSLAESHGFELRIIFFLFIAAFGVKTALVPLHGWLPKAMIAPAPVSALLHAVAVVKAGAFGIIRIVYDVYGVQTASDLGLLHPLVILACFTIVYGSLRALFQDELKKRLAYSTVSQVSYIVLGTAMLGPLAATGGLVHLVHQGIMKITLFFGAGNYAETLGVHHVSEMNGIGRKLPLTTIAFSIGALGMIGIYPFAGYISKAYLKSGAQQAGEEWVTWVLLTSSLLNAGYFLPILYRAWFMKPPKEWPKERAFGRWETHWMLMVPPLVTAILVIYAGLFAETGFTPLAWVKLIAARESGP